MPSELSREASNLGANWSCVRRDSPVPVLAVAVRLRHCISVFLLAGGKWRVIGFLGQRLVRRALPRLLLLLSNSHYEYAILLFFFSLWFWTVWSNMLDDDVLV